MLLSYGLLLLANGLFGTLLGLRSKLEGFSTETTGFIMAGYFLGLLLGALYAVWVVAAVGHIRSFAAFASIMSVAVLAHLLRIDPITWLVLRIVAGYCMAGMIMVAESWIHERSTNRTRGRVLSLYMVTNYLGSGLGQFLLTVASPAEFQLFVIASIIFSIALVPILVTQASSPKPVSSERMRFRDLFAVSPVGVVGTIAAGLINASLSGLGPIYAADRGLSIAQVSAFMASIILGGMVLQFPIGRLSDRLDRRTILILVALATSACALGIVWATREASWPMFLLAAAYGGFAFTVYPLSTAQVNDRADPDRLVQVAAARVLWQTATEEQVSLVSHEVTKPTDSPMLTRLAFEYGEMGSHADPRMPCLPFGPGLVSGPLYGSGACRRSDKPRGSRSNCTRGRGSDCCPS